MADPKMDWVPGDVPTNADFNRIEENTKRFSVEVNNSQSFTSPAGSLGSHRMGAYPIQVPDQQKIILLEASCFLSNGLRCDVWVRNPGIDTLYSMPNFFSNDLPNTTMYSNTSGSSQSITIETLFREALGGSFDIANGDSARTLWYIIPV